LDRDDRGSGTGRKSVGQIKEYFDRFLQQRSAATRGVEDFGIPQRDPAPGISWGASLKGGGQRKVPARYRLYAIDFPPRKTKAKRPQVRPIASFIDS
jgi:hypothetical protein